MGVFLWRYELDPEFPLCVLEYETPGSEDLMHSHDYLEIALCLDGHGVFRFGRREEPVDPGDVFLIGNLETHVAHALPGNCLRLLLVLFLPELIASPGCRDFDTAYLTPFADPVSPRIAHDTGLAAEVRPILSEIQACADRQDACERHVIDADLRRLLAAVIRHRGEVTPAAVGPSESELQLGPALVYVGEHFREPITLERVAETMHVSTSRARHVFKEVTSVGFKEYVTKLRLAEAKRLLLNTETKIADVAIGVGYTNLHQFYKVFYRYMGMSPADYRHHYLRPPALATPGRPLVAPISAAASGDAVAG